MNFRNTKNYSIFLMSQRANAPYRDRWDATRNLLIYEGHDARRESDGEDPKLVDQPLRFPSGRLTQNGRFYEAARKVVEEDMLPERVRVYEKIKTGIWSDKGFFLLVDARQATHEGRSVFEFLLEPIDEDADFESGEVVELSHTRFIPTNVKVEVWKRDKGQCVQCGASRNLHFDHDVPFSKGGSSLTAANVRLLCAKHNLEKSDRIQ